MDLKKSNYIAEIDGIRALAVLAVIINHTKKEFIPSGFLGVDIFFVISGFVITASLSSRQYSGFKEFIIGFYSRRIKRILPTLIVYVVLISVLISLLTPSPYQYLHHGITSIIGITNISLFRSANDYFAEASSLNPFTQTWSLGVEEQFYFLYPLLFWFTGFAKNNSFGLQKLFRNIYLLFFISLVIYVITMPINSSAAYYLMPFRFWEIATGALIFLDFSNRKYLIKYLMIIPAFVSFLALLLILFLPQKYIIFSSIIIVILTSNLISHFYNSSKGLISSILSNKVLVYIGKISYSLYLWHWGLLVLAKWFKGDNLYIQLIALSLSIFISIINYHYIEIPFRKSKFRFYSIKNILFIILYSSGIIVPYSLYKYSRITNSLFKFGSTVSNWENNYKPAVNKFQIPSKDCSEYFDSNKLNKLKLELSCTGSHSAKRKIFLLGDSHAGNHSRSLEKAIFSNQKLNEVLLIEARLHPNDFDTKDIWKNIRNQKRKRNWYKFLELLENNLTNKDIVLFATQRDDIIKTNYINSYLPRPSDSYLISNLEDKLKQIASITNNKNSSFILIDDLPKPCRNSDMYLIEVLKKGNYSLCKNNKEISLKDRKSMTILYKKISSLYPNTLYVDFHDFLCPGAKCKLTSPYNDNQLLYRDSSPHLYYLSNTILSEKWEKILLGIK